MTDDDPTPEQDDRANIARRSSRDASSPPAAKRIDDSSDEGDATQEANDSESGVQSHQDLGDEPRSPRSPLAVEGERTETFAPRSDGAQDNENESGPTVIYNQDGRRVIPFAESTFEHYEQGETTGTWRFGIVVRATHRHLNRPVRLRVMDARYANNEDVRERVLADARAAASLRHPNVGTRVFEAVDDGRAVYVALEPTVTDPLPDYRPSTQAKHWLYPNSSLAQMMAEAAAGLAAIHKAGIYHGHITTSAIAVDRQTGAVCLKDLGEPPVSDDVSSFSFLDAQYGRRQDLEDFARAFAEIVTGQETPAKLDAVSFARFLKRANRRLAPDIIATLSRCVETKSDAGIADADHLVEALRKPASRRVEVGGPLERLISFAFELAFVVILVPLASLALFVAILFLGMAGFEAPLGPIRGLETGLLANSDIVFYGGPAVVISILYLTVFDGVLGFSPARRIWKLRLIRGNGRAASLPQRFCWNAIRIACWLVISWALFAILSTSQVRAYFDNSVASLFLALLGGAFVYSGLTLVLPNRKSVADTLMRVTWGRTWQPQTPLGQTTTTIETASHSQTKVESSADVKRTGQYVIRDELGRGGMGTVYEAWDEVLHRRVALKVVSPKLAADAGSLARFEREALLAATINHEHVAKLFGVGREGKRPYLVMEFIEGKTLQQAVQARGSLNQELAWLFVQQAANGLAAADQEGIIHRDIKPSNLMLKSDESIVVMDFGLAKAITDATDEGGEQTSDASSHITVEDSNLTRAGSVLGTPMYMSPEQTMGEPTDCRSDIYSLGLTLHFMLTGEPPYQGGVAELLHQQREVSPLEDQQLPLTEERVAVLERMIAKDPEERYQNYQQLLRDLSRTSSRLDPLAKPVLRLAAEVVNTTLFWVVFWAFAIVAPMVASRSVTMQTVMTGALWATTATWLAVYVLGIAWLATTPGKWLFGLRVTDLEGKRLGIGRSFIRLFAYLPNQVLAAVFLFVSPLASVDETVWANVVMTLANIATYGLILASIALMSQTVSQRAVHDFAARSRVSQRG